MTEAKTDWGKPSGHIRHVQEGKCDGRDSAIYLIEEPPGFRPLRFKKRRYNIFFPWSYFFVQVLHEKFDFYWFGDVFAAIAKSRLKSLDTPDLRRAPFPNSTDGGILCLPNQKEGSPTPVEAAILAVDLFWRSNGNEFSIPASMLPEPLSLKVAKIGAIFSAWAKMSPKEVMSASWCKLDPHMNSPLKVIEVAFDNS